MASLFTLQDLQDNWTHVTEPKKIDALTQLDIETVRNQLQQGSTTPTPPSLLFTQDSPQMFEFNITAMAIKKGNDYIRKILSMYNIKELEQSQFHADSQKGTHEFENLENMVDEIIGSVKISVEKELSEQSITAFSNATNGTCKSIQPLEHLYRKENDDKCLYTNAPTLEAAGFKIPTQ